MIEAAFHLWRLCEHGADAFGPSCSKEGFFLGRTPLVAWREGRYVVRPKPDLEHLLARAYGCAVPVDNLLSGLAVVAAALNAGNLGRALIASVQLRLPDLPGRIARHALETADERLRSQQRETLRRWDSEKHPRWPAKSPDSTGGEFAPANGAGDAASEQIAQDEEVRSEEEDPLDPLGPVRQAQWDARMRILREIDPRNAALNYLSIPGRAPSQEALDRLTDALRDAATQRVIDRVMPYGKPMGRDGDSPTVREARGGLEGAQRLFDYLRVGGTEIPAPSGTRIAQLPGGAGYVTFRPVSNSGPPAVNINVPGIGIKTIHFPEGR